MSAVRSCRVTAAATLAVAGVALGWTALGAATASTHSAAVDAPKTVTASLIKRQKGTLAPGTTVPSADLGQRVFPTAADGFALASLDQAEYPAATTDGGKTWTTDGPALHLDAAQAPLSVTEVGAAGRKTFFAYGTGQVVDITSDAGKHWWRATFLGLVVAVARTLSGHLAVFEQVSSGASPSAVTLQYVSTDGGRHWRYSTRLGGY